MTKSIFIVFFGSILLSGWITLYSQSPATLVSASSSTFHMTNCVLSIKGLDNNYISVLADRLNKRVFINYDAKTFDYLKGQDGDKNLPALLMPEYSLKTFMGQIKPTDNSALAQNGLGAENGIFNYSYDADFDRTLEIEYGYTNKRAQATYSRVSPTFNSTGGTYYLFVGVSATLYDSAGIKKWSYVFPRIMTHHEGNIWGRPLVTISNNIVYIFYKDSEDNFSTKNISEIPENRSPFKHQIICIRIALNTGDMQKTVVHSFVTPDQEYFLSQAVQIDSKNFVILGHTKYNWGFYKLSITE